MPVPGVLTYSCTKTFVDFLGRGLNYELRDQIDCISWQAGETSTNMMRRPPGGRIVTTEVAVQGMLRDIGKEEMTYGCFKHAQAMSQLGMMPQSMIRCLMFRAFCRAHKNQIAAAAKQ